MVLVTAALLIEHVEPPPGVDRGLHERAAVVVVSDVALDGEGLDPRRFAVRHDLLGALLVARVVHHDVAAARGQELRAFAADAVPGARSGDDGGFAPRSNAPSPTLFGPLVRPGRSGRG